MSNGGAEERNGYLHKLDKDRKNVSAAIEKHNVGKWRVRFPIRADFRWKKAVERIAHSRGKQLQYRSTPTSN